MATLAATKEFMEALFVDDSKDEFYFDLNSFIREEVHGVTLICDFSSIDEYQSALLGNPLWEILMDKCDRIKFRPDLNQDLKNENFYQSLSEENIFLTSLTVEECEELSKARGYIYLSVADISRSWEPIKFIRHNGVFKVTNDPHFPNEMKFDNWAKLDRFCLPLTSVVIFDKYILGDKSNQKLKDNLFKILEKLCTNSLLKPLNVTIISEFESDEKIDKSYRVIEKFFAENSISNIKLNVIRHDKNKYPTDFEGLHYRLILTNNLRIKCDDSFNFFKSNGKVNNDADIHLAFHMSRKSKCFYEKEIKHLKRYISRIDNLDESVDLQNKIYFCFDKNNYLFN